MPARQRLACLAVLLGAAVSPTIAPAAPAPRANCDDIRGHTLAQNDRWRIVTVVDPEAYTYTWACRRDQPHPGRLLKLAEYDELDFDVILPPVLVGDRLYGSFNAGGHYESGPGSAIVLDLSTRAVAELWDRDKPAAWSGTSPWVSATGQSGAIVGYDAVPAPAVGATPVPTPGSEPSRIATFGDDGVQVQQLPVAAWAASRGGAGRAPGVYVTATDGTTTRIGVSGRADPPGAWQANARRLVRNPYRAPNPRSARRRTVFAAPIDGVDTATIDLRWGPAASGAIPPWSRRPLTLVRGAVGKPEFFASLAPGSGGDVKVLAATYDRALVTARYADAPERLQTRFLAIGHPPVMLAPGDVPTGNGDVAITADGALAILRSGRLIAYDPVRRTIPLAGASDLAATNASSSRYSGPAKIDPAVLSVYLTDASGQPARITLGRGPR